MASGPITSWQIDGETVETMRDFIFLGSKIPADGDTAAMKLRHLLLGRKVMTNLDSIFKSINSLALSFLYSPLSHPYITTRKTTALTRQTFIGKVMSAF